MAEAAPPPELKCPHCGSSNIGEDSNNYDEFLVCWECGCCIEDISTPETNGVPLFKPTTLATQPRTAARIGYKEGWGKEKERMFRRLLHGMMERAQLPKHEAKRCEEQGLILLREGHISRIKDIAAVIVFLALSKGNRMRYQEIEDLTGVKYKRIRAITKKLKQHIPNDPSSPSDEARAMGLLERMGTFNLTALEKTELFRIIADIWELISDMTVQGKRVSRGVPAECAVMIMATEVVKKTRIDGKHIDSIASNMNIRPRSFRTYMSKVQRALASLVHEVPSLGLKAPDRVSHDSVAKLLPALLRNKDLIIATLKENKSPSPKPSTVGPSQDAFLAPRWSPPEGDSELSDLDSSEEQEYLLTESEISERVHLESQQN